MVRLRYHSFPITVTHHAAITRFGAAHSSRPGVCTYLHGNVPRTAGAAGSSALRRCPPRPQSQGVARGSAARRPPWSAPRRPSVRPRPQSRVSLSRHSLSHTWQGQGAAPSSGSGPCPAALTRLSHSLSLVSQPLGRTGGAAAARRRTGGRTAPTGRRLVGRRMFIERTAAIYHR